MKKIAIIVRSRNDADILPRTLGAIYSQRCADFEVLVFDNASTDSTYEVLKNFPKIKVYNVPESAYVPGAVLNAAAQAALDAGADIVIFNNSDAVPVDEFWLENIVEPIANGRADIVYARQVCRADADFWVRLDYSKAFGDKPLSENFFSMASSAASAEVLAAVKFDSGIKYSEDVEWTRRAREAGYKVAYAPNAKAEHSHNYTVSQIRRRFRGEGAADAEIYGTGQGVLSMLGGFAKAVAKDAIYLAKNGKFSRIFSAVSIRWNQKYSYFSGRNSSLKKTSK